MIAACGNCEDDSRALVGKGLCARCYQYRRRTGRLPPSEHMRAAHGEGMGAKVGLTLERSVHVRLVREAKRRGLSIAAAVRQAIADWLGERM